MAKTKLDKADQFYEAFQGNEALQRAFINFADYLDDKRRDELWAIYNDAKLHEAYRSWRTFNSLHNNGFSKNKDQREIVRLHPLVYQFLQDIFEPIYGPKWLQNKKVLRHELVRPWWLVERI